MTTQDNDSTLTGWRKSPYSNNGGNCVEVNVLDRDEVTAGHKADADRLFVMRDSKDPAGPRLRPRHEGRSVRRPELTRLARSALHRGIALPVTGRLPPRNNLRGEGLGRQPGAWLGRGYGPRHESAHGTQHRVWRHPFSGTLTRAIGTPCNARCQHRFSTRPGNDGK
jgi:hypothetical protein